MYPHWCSLMPNIKWHIVLPAGAFSFGFYRGIRADYQEPYDLIGHRIGHSLVNGMVHVFPPYGLIRATYILNRADVAWNNKDPSKYPSIYSEGAVATNHRIL